MTAAAAGVGLLAQVKGAADSASGALGLQHAAPLLQLIIANLLPALRARRSHEHRNASDGYILIGRDQPGSWKTGEAWGLMTPRMRTKHANTFNRLVTLEKTPLLMHRLVLESGGIMISCFFFRVDSMKRLYFGLRTQEEKRESSIVRVVTTATTYVCSTDSDSDRTGMTWQPGRREFWLSPVS